MENDSGNGNGSVNVSGNDNGKWKMANDSGNGNGSGNGIGNGNGNINGNEWKVPTLYKQHEMKTLTILDFFLSSIILFSISLLAWWHGVETFIECEHILPQALEIAL